jgi:hypothetical protein
MGVLGSYELDMSRDVLAEDRATMRTELLRFNGAVERDPAIDAWMKEHAGELGAIAHQWFEVMRKCGDEVRELLHDGCPVACLGDAPFGYVNVFTSHVNVGFFHGAALPDPARLLQGAGKFMRHVKLTGNGHKCRGAKQAHRYGVLGYKGARRKRLARISHRPPTVVARTLVSAASRLVSTLFRPCDILSKAGVDRSIRAVCKRATVT